MKTSSDTEERDRTGLCQAAALASECEGIYFHTAKVSPRGKQSQTSKEVPSLLAGIQRARGALPVVGGEKLSTSY